jgi:hypothetical protein
MQAAKTKQQQQKTQSNKSDGIVVWCIFMTGSTSYWGIKVDSYHVIYQKRNE